MTLLQEIRRRWNEESPKFWKLIKNFWIVVGSVSGVIVAMEVGEIDILKEALPPAIARYGDKIIHYALAISVISALQAKLAVKNPNDLSRPGDNIPPQ